MEVKYLNSDFGRPNTMLWKAATNPAMPYFIASEMPLIVALRRTACGVRRRRLAIALSLCLPAIDFRSLTSAAVQSLRAGFFFDRAIVRFQL